MKTKSRIKRPATRSTTKRQIVRAATPINSGEPGGTETLALLLTIGGFVCVLWWYLSLPLLLISWWLSNTELKKRLTTRAMSARALSIVGMFVFGYIYLGLMVWGLVLTQTPSSLF